ncbi:MAG TPA: hypothetical protein VKA15_16365, partial [Isosphaeraceae bacterium]|nr:hypothetical protein [Isosphaeraceae bacterium]
SKEPDGTPIELAEVLVRELTNFRERITESANMTYEARQGQHDDLVLATALPIWLGSQRFCQMVERVKEDSPGYRSREAAALDAEDAWRLEQQAVRELEQAALARERLEEEREREEARFRPRWAAKKRTKTAADIERDKQATEAIRDGSFWDDKRWGNC